MGSLTKLSLQSDDLTVTKLSVAIDATKMELHNFTRRPGKYISEFLGNCTAGKWQWKELKNSESSHENAFRSILESTLHYIEKRFQGNEVTTAFTVFDPADWPQEISQLASFGEQEVELLVKHFNNVLPTECSLVKVLEEWTDLMAEVGRQNLKKRSTINPAVIYERVFQNRAKFEIISAFVGDFLCDALEHSSL